jgi:tRNA(Ile)-lysidine synthase
MKTLPERPRLTPPVADSRRLVREIIESLGLENHKVLVGFSGGADSLALLSAISFEASKYSLEPIALIIDHGLQDNSEQVAANAKQTAEGLGVQAHVKKVSVGSEGGLENAARDARYEAFTEAMAEFGAEYVFLGHNLNDQAESVLLGLMRGSGPRAIAGMSQVSDWVLRPLLSMTRDELRQACSDQGLEFWDDPHNSDSKFSRVQIRKILADLQASGSGGVVQSLARTAMQMQEAEQIINPLIDSLVEKIENKKIVPVNFLEVLNEPYRRRVIHKLGQLNGSELGRVHVLEVEKLVTNWHGQKPLNLPGITVSRVENHLHFD